MKENYTFQELLNSMIEDYQISVQTLSKISCLPESYIEECRGNPPIIPEYRRKKSHLFDTAGCIAMGFSCTEDEYLRDHFALLQNDYQIKLSSISKFTEIDESVLEDFIQARKELSMEDKYKLAVRFLSFEWLLTRKPSDDPYVEQQL